MNNNNNNNNNTIVNKSSDAYIVDNKKNHHHPITDDSTNHNVTHKQQSNQNNSSNNNNELWSKTIRVLISPTFIAGTLGGGVSTVLLYPLDLIKVRLQVNESHYNNSNLHSIRTSTHHSSFTTTTTTTTTTTRPKLIQITKGIIRHEGFRGLYQGLSPSLLGSAISWGGYFYFYDWIKSQMILYKQQRSSSSSQYCTKQNTTTKSSVVLGPIENFSASCLSGAIMVLFTNPIWLIKTRMQLQIKQTNTIHPSTTTTTTTEIKQPYRNIFDAMNTIIKEEGVLALYKGSLPALMLVSHGGIQFMTYEYLKSRYHQRYFSYSSSTSSSLSLNATSTNNNNNVSISNKKTILQKLQDSIGFLTMGALSKIVASTSTYPLQVIKSRLQQRTNHKYQSHHANDLTSSTTTTTTPPKRNTNYKGVIDCIVQIYKNEGIVGYFKGLVPNLMRVAPNAAITFVVYESVLDYLS